MTDELPPGWAIASLGSLGRWLGGGTPSKAVREYWENGTVHWVSPKDMKRPLIDSAQDQITEKAIEESATNLVPANSVLMVTRSGILEHSFPVAVNTVPVTMNQDLKAVAVRGVDAVYTSYFLQSRAQDILRACKKDGTTVASIDTDRLAAYQVLVAPAAEQQRIVSKIDELFSRIDEGERALERVQKLVERYRQSVLKAAVTGELTRDWREKNKDKLESGEALLARILRARREAWEKAELDKMKAKGTMPANDKWKQKYEEPAAPTIDDLPELPEGWVWASTEQICSSVRDGTHDTPKYVTEGVPLITSKNLLLNGLSFEDVQLVSIDDHKAISKRSGVEPGDILFAMIGTIGNPVVVRAEREFSIKNVGLFKRNESFIAPDYLRVWLSSPLFNGWLEPRKKGTSQKFAPLGLLRAIPVPLPCLMEQQRIVDEADRLLLNGAHVAAGISEQAVRSSALRQTILRSAFSGGLSTQQSSDEPAADLLERIATERDHAPAKPKPKRGRKPKTSEPA